MPIRRFHFHRLLVIDAMIVDVLLTVSFDSPRRGARSNFLEASLMSNVQPFFRLTKN